VTQASQISKAKEVSSHLQEQAKVPFAISSVDLDAVSDEVAKSKRYIVYDVGQMKDCRLTWRRRRARLPPSLKPPSI
jgi:hypothetical protein